MSDAYATAFKLLTLGFSVIPSGGGDKGKAPLVNWREYQTTAPDESQLEAWESQLKPHLWGIITSDRIAVIDTDTPETRRDLEAEIGEPHVVTPRGGAHWYVDTAGHPMKTVVGLLPGIDVRGVGGFVNIAGGQYQILRLPVPGVLIPWGKLPKRILAALNGSKPVPKTKQRTPIPDTKRNATLTSIAGAMRRKGADQAAIEAALLEINASQCQPPLAESEVLRIAASVSRYEPKLDTEQPAHFNLTDAGNAEYFTDQYGDKLRYDHQREHWLEWEKHRWKPENDGYIMRLALKAARERYKAAINVADLDLREKIARWAISSEQRARLEACIAIARDLKPIADSGEHWDTDGLLFCIENGVVDLRTGELRTGKQENMITMQSPVVHDAEAKAPRWLQFIKQVTGGNVELATYLQRAVGYSLTGETKNQLWFFLYGLGTNGKTTFTMTIRRLMGDYGVRLDNDDLMIKDKKLRGSSPKEGVADTRGKRYAVASEVQDGKMLDIGLLKDMTGQDTIKARRLYEHEIEFLPTHKLWMFGNHKPIITDTTNAAWRRLKLLPFSFTVPENEIDFDLQTKLDAELPGILNWAIEGCLQWQRDGFTEPRLVTDAVTTYRHESDILADFIEDCCILEPLAAVPKSELKKIYESWYKENNAEPVTQRIFKARLIEKGIGEGRSGKTRFWGGIRLKNNTDDDDGHDDKSDKTLGDLATKVTRDNESPKSRYLRNENETLCGKPVISCHLVTNDITAELPDCPACGLNEWAAAGPDNDLVCPCGYRLKGAL